MDRKLILTGCIPASVAMAIDSIFLRKPAQTPTHIQTNNTSSPSNFVAISDGKFMLEGHPHYFVGTDFWQAMNLGADGPGGERWVAHRRVPFSS